MRKNIYKNIVAALFLALGIFSAAGPVVAQQQNGNAASSKVPPLNIFVHKNDPYSTLWDEVDQQMKITYFRDDQKLGETYYPPNLLRPVNGNANAAPQLITEAFVSLDIVTQPGTYRAVIEAGADGAIPRYKTDQSGTTVQEGTIDIYQCIENPLLPLKARCEYSIQISEQDILNRTRRNEAFRLDLVVIPKELAREPDVEDTLIEGKNSEYDQLVTFVGRFAARIQSLLNWSLAITQESFANPTIERVFSRVLNIVNGFFIVVLLAIAFMWNLSIVIPKKYLRKIVIIFFFAAILVNFALPVNRLLINITNSVQNSFLVKDVRTEEGIRKQRITSQDLLMIYGVEYGDFVGESKADYLDKRYPDDSIPPSFPQGEKLNEFGELQDRFVNRNKEPIYFNIALVALGSIGQLLIALLIILRIIILWFLLILSPFLFLLFTLNFLKQFFRYWIWFYFRWLFIGPILAMCLYIIVNIWSLTGVPIESTAPLPGGLSFDNATNLYLAAPGVFSGFLNTPREVMKYLAALLMLYLSVLLPFWLTRRIGGGECCMDQGLLSKLRTSTKISPGSTRTTSSVSPVVPSPQPPSLGDGLAVKPGNTVSTDTQLKNLNIEALRPEGEGFEIGQLTGRLGESSATATTARTEERTADGTRSGQAEQSKDQSQLQEQTQSQTSSSAQETIQSSSSQAQLQTETDTTQRSGASTESGARTGSFTERDSLLDTRSLLQKVNLAPITNPSRNEVIDRLSKRETVASTAERATLNALYRELDKRAQGGDRLAQQAINDVKQAERFAREEGVSSQKGERLQGVDDTQQIRTNETGDLASTTGSVEQAAAALQGQNVSQEQSTRLSQGDEVMQLKEEVVGALTAGENKESVKEEVESSIERVDRSDHVEVKEKVMMAELDDPDTARLEAGEEEEDKNKREEQKKDEEKDEEGEEATTEENQDKEENENELEAGEESEELDDPNQDPRLGAAEIRDKIAKKPDPKEIDTPEDQTPLLPA